MMSPRVLCLMLGCACGRPAQPVAPAPVAVVPEAAVAPVPLERDLPRLAERSTRLYQDIAAAFAATGERCASATARLDELQATYADVIAANAKVLHEGRDHELRGALEPHAGALDRAANAIVQSVTMARCAQDVAFTDAFDRLAGAPP